ncbi:PH domain-containing protein [Streptomyces sp. NPDC020192]|uniref:PH domain-containing protein n=1 Tax=Streptomyces sp. NPDC020192 TaxID=3365066 RepID=UPI0037B3E794
MNTGEGSARGGWAKPLAYVLLLLLLAAGVARSVAAVTADERAWDAARPCAAGERGDECLSTVPAVIERTDPQQPKKRSHLYFTDGRPVRGLEVSYEAAESFEAGDRVELTFWRGQVMTVSGQHYVWHEHVTTGGSMAVLAAVLVLGAGYPGARLLVLVRGRRQPVDEVLPSHLPFLAPLVGTAVWLFPLCYRHPTSLSGSTEAVVWWAAGGAVSLGLFAWAWRATRIRVPDETGVPVRTRELPDGEDVFLSARFLEHTDYNPHHFGTHVVLGADGPAVTPHPGPGRFAARPVPVQRLTLRTVRRARGEEGELVPHSWHIAELDDGGRTVRLAAAPDDLTRILRALAPARA